MPTAYITLGFWDIAPKTAHPDLWAVFGRIISITEGFIVCLLTFINDKGYFLTMLTTSALLSIIVFLVSKENNLKEPDWQTPQTDTIPVTENMAAEAVVITTAPEDIFDEFSKQYRLTPREREVMYSMLHSDDKIKTIATEIGLSGRMVYRYMNQLYEKLNTENRADLMKVYFDFESKHNK